MKNYKKKEIINNFLWEGSLIGLILKPKRIRNRILSFLSRSILIHPRLRVKLVSYMGVKFDDPSTVYIGSNVCFDEVNPHLIQIGKNVHITEGVKILTHFYELNKPPHQYWIGPVVIEENVFLGVNVVITNSIRIGNSSVIGANSVVTRDIPPQVIAVGTPCKPVGDRSFSS